MAYSSPDTCLYVALLMKHYSLGDDFFLLDLRRQSFDFLRHTRSNSLLFLCWGARDMPYLVRVGVLAGFSPLVAQLGGDPSAILQRLGLEQDILDSEDDHISLEVITQLLELAAKETRCDHFSLLLSSRQGLSSAGLVGLAMQAAPDMRAALNEVISYLSLQGQGIEWNLKVAGELAYCTWTFHPPTPRFIKQCVQLGVGNLFFALNAISGKRWNPVSINFHYDEPEEKAFYRRILRAPIMFNSDFDGIVFKSSDLDLMLPERQDYLLSVLHSYMTSLKDDTSEDFPSQVKRMIRQAISQENCDIESIAVLLNCSKRTLQRKLNANGVSFLSLREDVRFDLALHYLRETNMSLSNISELIGFAELSIFSRTFKNRFGESPTQWRINHSGSDKVGV